MSNEIPSLPSIDAAQPASPAPTSRRASTLIVGAVALVLLGWQWADTRTRIADLQDELMRRTADGDNLAKEGRVLAKEAQDRLQELQGKVGALEARLNDSQGQQAALEAMYQDFARTRDDRVLGEVDQAVAIAVQQLQLAGNVQAALFALQTADARLGNIDRPQWLPLRKALAGDIETLKALPQVDAGGMVLKLETLIGRLDNLPLAFEAKPKADEARVDRAEIGWLKGLWLDFWAEFSQLVRIERMDRPDPALLAPSNAVFLRENLKLRLLNARLALLSRDGNTFREDVRLAAQWLERYFDARNSAVQAAAQDLAELRKAPVGVDLPTLQASQAALRGLLAVPEKRAEAAQAAAAHSGKPAKKN